MDIPYSAIPIEPVHPGRWADALPDTIGADEAAVFAGRLPLPDGFSADAHGWLARDALGTLIGFGCLQDQRGQIAVAPAHRRQWLGSVLLQRLVRHALDQGLARIEIDCAAEHAGFFLRRGFVATSASNDTVHTPSRLRLTRALRSLPRLCAPTVADPQGPQPLRGIDDFRMAAAGLAEGARRRIDLLSVALDPRMYANPAFTRAVTAFALAHRDARLRMLVRDSRALSERGHPLLRLYRQLPSRVQIRRLPAESRIPPPELLLVDGTGVLCKRSLDHYLGRATRHGPEEAATLGRDFDALWTASEPDAELRLMRI